MGFELADKQLLVTYNSRKKNDQTEIGHTAGEREEGDDWSE